MRGYHPRDKRSDYIKPEDRAPEAREDLYITRHNKGSGKDQSSLKITVVIGDVK